MCLLKGQHFNHPWWTNCLQSPIANLVTKSLIQGDGSYRNSLNLQEVVSCFGTADYLTRLLTHFSNSTVYPRLSHREHAGNSTSVCVCDDMVLDLWHWTDRDPSRNWPASNRDLARSGELHEWCNANCRGVTGEKREETKHRELSEAPDAILHRRRWRQPALVMAACPVFTLCPAGTKFQGTKLRFAGKEQLWNITTRVPIFSLLLLFFYQAYGFFFPFLPSRFSYSEVSEVFIEDHEPVLSHTCRWGEPDFASG